MNDRKHSKQLFSVLIEKHQAIIHKITLVYARNKADRDDLFQEICLQLWKAYPNYREESKFSTWMYRVSLNTAISDVRKNKNKPTTESLHNTEYVPEESTLNNEQVEDLYDAITKLNRIDKAIIILWLEEKSYEEIAAIMGTSKTNVSVKLVRIKRKLEEMVNQKVKQES